MTTAKKSVAKKRAAAKSMPAAGKDPKGGLTAAGRRYFKEKEGLNLKPGVTGAADTPEKMKRKGSFLTRTFTHPRGPMVKDGEPTRLALSAHAWGEAVPKTEAEAKKLAAKGREAAGKVPCGAGEGGGAEGVIRAYWDRGGLFCRLVDHPRRLHGIRRFEHSPRMCREKTTADSLRE